MNVARARSSRRYYDAESGLECLRCHDLFKKASTFMRHPCYRQMQDQHLRASILEQLKTASSSKAPFETLQGKQLPLIQEESLV
jgi:uncharacterized C2H2 Zn-finger protein